MYFHKVITIFYRPERTRQIAVAKHDLGIEIHGLIRRLGFTPLCGAGSPQLDWRRLSINQGRKE